MQEDTYRGTAYDPLSLNLYTYCANDPIQYTDPTGHTYWDYSGTLEKGNSGKDVKVVQYKLVQKGYLTMIDSKGKAIDYGYFGDMTQKALLAFEKDILNTIKEIEHPHKPKPSNQVAPKPKPTPKPTPKSAPKETGKDDPFGDKWFISAEEANAKGLTTPTSNSQGEKELKGFGLQVEISVQFQGLL